MRLVDLEDVRAAVRAVFRPGELRERERARGGSDGRTCGISPGRERQLRVVYAEAATVIWKKLKASRPEALESILPPQAEAAAADSNAR